jgi:nucleoside-diphosphate-sugar epimerase
LKYLIAGGAGFIGSNLSKRLLDDGHEVVCLDNLVTGRRKNIAPLEADPRFLFINHDVIEPLPLMPEFDGIFHLASPASPPGYKVHAVETMRVNSEGTLRLLRLAELNRAKFLYASTSEAYGDPLEHPQREDYRGNVSSIGPRSMYDEAKRYGEALTSVFHSQARADVRIVRIFNTYGPNSDPEDGRLVPNFITQALRDEPMTIYGDGAQTRSLCYVSDLVEGLIRALHSSDTRGIVTNLGNPEEHTVYEFADTIRRLCKSNSTLVHLEPAVGDDPQRRRPDIGRAQALLNWEPRISLEQGLQDTIEYFREEISEPLVAQYT